MVKRSVGVVKRSACPERSVGVVEAIVSRAKKVGLEMAPRASHRRGPCEASRAVTFDGYRRLV